MFKNGKPIVLKDVMDTIEQDILHRTLIRFKKQTRAADFLGLREQTLRYKMIRLKIPTIRANQTYYMEHQTEDLNK
jgi:DNA-binding protein Fis